MLKVKVHIDFPYWLAKDFTARFPKGSIASFYACLTKV